MQEKKTRQTAKPEHSGSGLDKHWHLSTNDHEIALTEIEFSIFRISASFTRWMDDLAACCSEDNDHACGGIDFAVLNIIRMHDRHKSISEIARLMNRDDMSNLQYSIRKLTKAGFIKKTGGSSNKKGAAYTTTEQGLKTTETYARYRKELLTPLTEAISDSGQRLTEVTKMLSLMSGIYNQAACVAATHRHA